ncbi:nucleotide-sugar transporter [Athelia psychrophila]|uniref:Nucleotide-sugar transporter n=1 Tax=Athelia psychrophila TaxID=1759441 RepID=A0A167V256_9AGAM|nr:nucleotide-sugar transporter [Fibularhizoctonia sp. CBS 109695]
MSSNTSNSKIPSGLHLNLNIPQNLDLEYEELGAVVAEPAVPSLWGIPLKYISLVTLAVQNSLLTIIMHYSRVSTPPSRAYSAATAVLLNELLKCSISLVIAFSRIDRAVGATDSFDAPSPWSPRSILARSRALGKEVFSRDCWKLSIPAILYVIQNNLQFVAASNLDPSTFQVSYQMKILTTAGFSVLLLRKKLTPSQWFALLFLAIGVGVVQIQTSGGGAAKAVVAAVTSAPSLDVHSMNAIKGFLAVAAACFTSGLAGVYFEMVLKNSQADLWVRNVQLSAFSLLPALMPVLVSRQPGSGFAGMFDHFGGWAWATVLIQVFGGLVTALVIKYSDNICKGFATSLSIVISFLASVALFDFQMSFTFVLGSTIVLAATWLYNSPAAAPAGGKEAVSWGLTWAEKARGSMSPRLPADNDDMLDVPLITRKASSSSVASQSSANLHSHSIDREEIVAMSP